MHLVAKHGYPESYNSVVSFVRSRYPRPMIRTYQRVETLPGAQTQTDWGEFPRVDVGEGPVPRKGAMYTDYRRGAGIFPP